MDEIPPDDAEIIGPDADGFVWAHWTDEEGVFHMLNLTVLESEGGSAF